MITALLALALVVARDVAPDGWTLARALGRVAVRAHLPTAVLEDAAQGLWLRPAAGDEAPPARFRPPLANPRRDWPRPRIELARRHFATALPALAIEDLPVDSMSGLYGALIEAVLSGRDSAPWLAAAAGRAQATIVDAPADQRLDSFVEAGTAFLAHALVVAHEVARHERRRRARGTTLCGRFDARASLFGLWQHDVFGSGRYSGYYRNAAGAWAESKSALTVEDRRWWVEAILGAAWRGDPAVDFAWICRSD